MTFYIGHRELSSFLLVRYVASHASRIVAHAPLGNIMHIKECLFLFN